MKGLPAITRALPGFRFLVMVENAPLAAFTECTLPVIQWETEEIKEGGINTFIHQVPGRRRSAKLTLKNGVGNIQLLDWYFDALKGKFSRRNVSIILLDSLMTPTMVWDVQGAFPVQWSGPTLRADDNTIAVQTLELACDEIDVVLLKPGV